MRYFRNSLRFIFAVVGGIFSQQFVVGLRRTYFPNLNDDDHVVMSEGNFIVHKDERNCIDSMHRSQDILSRGKEKSTVGVTSIRRVRRTLLLGVYLEPRNLVPGI